MATGERRQFYADDTGQNARGLDVAPFASAVFRTVTNNKIRAIPVRVLFNDTDLNLRAEYSAFDRHTGRPFCVGNGETAKRVSQEGIEEQACHGPKRCQFAQQQGCKLYGG